MLDSVKYMIPVHVYANEREFLFLKSLNAVDASAKYLTTL